MSASSLPKCTPGRWIASSRIVSVLDLVVLLGNVCRGNAEAAVGWEDAERSINEMINELNRRIIHLKHKDLESALWSANLLHEQGKFWHPKGKPFHEWLSDIMEKNATTFDALFNLVEKK